MSDGYTMPTFTVVIDTNVIFDPNPSVLIRPQFASIWQECSDITGLTLVIPDVVKQERLVQVVSNSEELLEVANNKLKTIGELSSCRAKQIPTKSEVKKGIEKSFNDWLASVGALLMPVPYNKINWERVVTDAIWRGKPFEPYNKDKGEKNEKGFRDCMILETVCELVKSTTNEQVVFITQDELLREAAIARNDAKALLTYENLSAFLSFLKLSQSDKSQKFILKVLAKAPKIFYTEDDPDCVYFKHDIVGRIHKEYSYLLDSYVEFPKLYSPNLLENIASYSAPDYSTPPAITAPHQAGTLSFYSPTSEERVMLNSTEFVEVEESGVLKWKTRLNFVRLFNKSEAAQTLGHFWSEIIRFQPFNVIWTAKVSADIEFTDIEIVGIESESQTTRLAFTEKEKYGFPSPYNVALPTAAKLPNKPPQ